MKLMHLNLFMTVMGHHESGWRHPRAEPDRVWDIDYFTDIARTAERGCFDSVFFADAPAVALGDPSVGRPTGSFDPLVLLTALAGATEHLGLIATASTTFNHVYNLARRFASIDHVSRGRAGWNIVTTWSQAAAPNFGLDEMPSSEDRYALASEFVDVAMQLWDSWEEDAVVNDPARGVCVDHSKLHRIDHVGERLRVQGPLTLPRSPQGYPVLVQAGSSEQGRDFAARYAEVIFTAQLDIDVAVAFAQDIRSRAAALGRPRDSILILPGFSPIVGSTEAEAKAAEAQLHELTGIENVVEQLSSVFGGFDLASYPLDGPVPGDLILGTAMSSGWRSRSELMIDLARRQGLTIRQLAYRHAGAHGHYVFAGAPEQVADEMQRWIDAGAADGFNIMPPYFPGSFNDVVDFLIPELQRRGVVRRTYEGVTLRDNYGLTRPDRGGMRYGARDRVPTELS
jgi:FMN-dependent oxidoreductase (nitrilotriacetate monooxygenase family)